jgi:hypothetical protein
MPILSGPDRISHARWSDLASSVERLALAVAGVPGGDAGIEVLNAICGIEDAQTKMLSRIDETVSLLREGPFRTGCLLFEEAGRVGKADADYRQLLRDARSHFYDATSVAASEQELAVVEFHLALAYALEGRHDSAEHWLMQSDSLVKAVVRELSTRAGNTKLPGGKMRKVARIYANTSPPVAAAKLVARTKRVWNAERARAALDDFEPFASCVANALAAITGAPHIAETETSPVGRRIAGYTQQRLTD